MKSNDRGKAEPGWRGDAVPLRDLRTVYWKVSEVHVRVSELERGKIADLTRMVEAQGDMSSVMRRLSMSYEEVTRLRSERSSVPPMAEIPRMRMAGSDEVVPLGLEDLRKTSLGYLGKVPKLERNRFEK